MSPDPAGALLVAAGLLLRWWGMQHLIRHAGLTVTSLQTVRQPDRWLRSGPFRLRHPLYLGSLLLIAGLGMLSLGWGGAIVAYAALPFYLDRIRQEEELRAATKCECKGTGVVSRPWSGGTQHRTCVKHAKHARPLI